MFVLKSLQIPLLGRHPPSPALSNGSAANGYFILYLSCRMFGPFADISMK